MATNKSFNVSPYYDDYDDAVAENGSTHRILFKPGKGIQARELTQLQTIAQRQIERFGEHVFAQGSHVSGANQTYNTNANYVKLEAQFDGVDITGNYKNNFVGKISLARANVTHVESKTSTDPTTLYVRYTSGAQFKTLIFTGTITSAFIAGETVTGGTSGATGLVRRWDATNKRLWITQVVTATAIPFTASETVTATVSNGTDSLSSASGSLTTSVNYAARSNIFFPGEEIFSDVTSLISTVTPTGTFEIGDVVVADVSGATGQVIKFDSAAKELNVIPLTGTFATGDTVTSAATSGTFKVSGSASMVLTSVANLTVTKSANVGGGSDSSISTAVGLGTLFSIDSGVFFVNGFFAKVNKQTLALEKYSSNGTHRVGLNITETLVDSNDDSSLLDNAQGSSNENATGADRYKITLFLARRGTSNVTDQTFVELVQVKAGVLEKQAAFPIYSELGKTLARRTFDESGSYTVRDFRMHLEDHASDTTKFYSKLDPGKAFVGGYEHETIAPNRLTHDRSRTFASVDNGDTLMQFGTYALVETVKGAAGDFFDTTAQETLDLHCTLAAGIVLTNDDTYTRTLAGTARIRHFGKGAAAPADSSTPGSEDYRMYLYDFKFHSILGTAQAGAATTITLDTAENTTDDAYNGATIELIGGTGSGQVRTITNYVGSSKVATVSTWTTTPDNTSVYRMSFNFKNIQSVVRSTAYTTATAPVVANATADIAVAGRYGGVAREATYKITTLAGDAFGDAKLFDTDVNSLIFPIGESNIKAIDADSVTYQFQRKFTDQTFSGGTLTLTAPSNEEFYTGSAALSASIKNEAYVVVHKSGSVGSTSLAAGDIIDFTTGSRTITPNESARQVTFNTTDGSYVGVCDIYARMRVDGAGANPKSKTLSANIAITNVVINTNNNNTASLGYSDIDSLVSVIDTGAASANITTSFVLDNGQKDNWYDHGKIRKKNDGVSITGPLTVTFKHYTHSGTGFCSVDSYAGIDYGSITEYTSPATGTIHKLAEVLDFRPRRPDESGTDHRQFKTTHGTAGAGAATTITLQTSTILSSATSNAYADCILTITGGTGKGQVRRIVSNTAAAPTVATVDATFDITPDSTSVYTIEDRRFTMANIEIPYPNTNLSADYDYYLSRVDKVYIDDRGTFGVIAGVPAITPRESPDLENTMSLYALFVPAYTSSINDVDLARKDNKRYTMKDIGKFEDRINKLEYYTSLSLLEKDASSQLVRDTAGNERFKNGIIVDNFTGHGVGDVLNEDYKASIDTREQYLRPPFLSDQVDMSTSFSATLSDGVTKTGDLVTLSYTTDVFVSQTHATTGVNLNPYSVLPFIGNLSLNPPGDTWVDTTTRPTVHTNISGDYDAWISGASNGFGTQWNDWQTNSSGTTTSSTNPSFGTPGRSTVTTNTAQTRTGIQTTVTPRTVTESLGDRIVDVNVQPFIRAKTVTITATGMKPNTRLWPYFDDNDVSTICTPSGGTLGVPIYSDSNGAVTITMAIPAGTYRTGEKVVRLLSNSSNSLSSASSRADATFFAVGLLQSKQGLTLSTRVRQVSTRSISEDRVVSRTDIHEIPLRIYAAVTGQDAWEDDPGHSGADVDDETETATAGTGGTDDDPGAGG